MIAGRLHGKKVRGGGDRVRSGGYVGCSIVEITSCATLMVSFHESIEGVNPLAGEKSQRMSGSRIIQAALATGGGGLRESDRDIDSGSRTNGSTESSDKIAEDGIGKLHGSTNTRSAPVAGDQSVEMAERSYTD